MEKTLNLSAFETLDREQMMEVDGGNPLTEIVKIFGGGLAYDIAKAAWKNKANWGVQPNDPCRNTALWKIYCR
ncbi:MAG: hypothetical protein KBS74_00285 [Clostridiales bacterium]|nr:hypothetical protein [Candidatus Cacconaster stercorequi]